MPRATDRTLSKRTALAAAISALLPGLAAGNAGRVDFAIGDVRAEGSNGQERRLAKGASIEAGDTIRTLAGRAHIRFTDGAYVSLKPNSEFRVDEYEYAGEEDGTEKSFFSLLKGGLRTITGLIGRSRKDAYRMNTSVATIGIRGTHFSVDVGEGTQSDGASMVNYNDSGRITVAYNPTLFLPAGWTGDVRVDDAGQVFVEFTDVEGNVTGEYQLMTTSDDGGGSPAYELVYQGEEGTEPTNLDIEINDTVIGGEPLVVPEPYGGGA